MKFNNSQELKPKINPKIDLFNQIILIVDLLNHQEML